MQQHIHTHHAFHQLDHDHDGENAQAKIKVAILFSLGVYFSHNILSGNLANYINARFAWLSYLAAGLFFVLAGFSAYSLWRSRSHDHSHDHHHPVSWAALFIVSIPLLLGTLIPSRPLGAEAIDGRINLTGVAVPDPSSFSVSPLDRNILDWLRIFNQSDDLSAFNGQEAKFIGFVYREPSYPQNTFVVARFAISCCVADSTSMGLPVYWEGIENIQDGEWVEVRGEFGVGEFDEDTLPILQAQTVETVEQPAHPYLYP